MKLNSLNFMRGLMLNYLDFTLENYYITFIREKWNCKNRDEVFSVNKVHKLSQSFKIFKTAIKFLWKITNWLAIQIYFIISYPYVEIKLKIKLREK